jgi:hypothetical protein
MNQRSDLFDEITEKFLQLEEDLDVFDIKPDGVPIWERIRFNLFENVREELEDSGQALTRTEYDSSAYLKGIQLWLKNLFVKNPLLAGEHDFLFYGHPRRKRGSDEKWWDIYCDPITSATDLDYLHVEKPYLMGHKSPVKTENLRYLDFVWYTGAIRRNLGISDVIVSGEERERLNEVSRTIKNRFDIDVDVVERAETKLTRRDSTLDLYKRFLQRVDPRVVIVVVSYGKHTFLEACHDLNIPTVELQHGVIHSNHIGYSFPGCRTKETFPDYMLTWGEFWNNNTDFVPPEENVISVGYPYLEQRKKEYENLDQDDQIIFISQGTVGPQLSKFAIEASEHPNIDHDIMYKLHPGEYDRWRDEYPWLVDSDLRVIDSSEPPLYKLFAESSAQVGVRSTAVFEGLCFDIETYVYKWPGSSRMEPLVEAGAAKIISSVDELASSLGTSQVSFDRECYFESNSTEKTYRTLQQIADN